MEAPGFSAPPQATAKWRTFPRLEILGLFAVQYRRVLFGLVVALGVLFVQERHSSMDSRFFQFSGGGIRGLIQYEMGRYRSAALAYRADLRRESWKEWTTGDESYTALLKGNLSEAVQLAEVQLARQPDDTEAWLTQGEVALEEGDHHRAVSAFDHVVTLDNRNFDALLLSAIAHSRFGNIDKAINRMRQALRYNYAGHRITAFLWGLQTAGDLRLGSPDGGQWCLLAHFYRYLRIFDSSNATWARDAAIRAINSGSRIDDAYITLGVLEEKAGDYDAALPYFIQSVQTNPRNAEAYRRAANIYRHRGSDFLNEYQMWKGAYAASPSDGFYRDGLVAFLIERFGDYPQALELVRQALGEEPQNKELVERFASLHQRLGKHDDAIRLYRDLLALKPHNPGAWDAIGYSLSSLERYDEAAVAYQRALAINSIRPQSHSGLGAVYARQGRYADSIREYEAALEVGGDDINTRAYLCSQYWAVNRYDDAEACLKHVLQRDPHNKTAMQIYPYVMKGLEHSRHER